jgi:23S rRNA (cytidine1920-2'-O)/16S rRNA (cytidine1409-2'-O)-methyltransferase
MPRLNAALLNQGLATSRTQADDYISLGLIKVNGKIVKDAEYNLKSGDKLSLSLKESYVSRGGLKLASVATILGVGFKDKIVLDVGSSTGGFTDYALKRGATKVIAIDAGTNQLHPSLHNNPKIDLREQLDIRSVQKLDEKIDLVMIDVSFISLRLVLPSVINLIDSSAVIIALLKPQFEAPQAYLNKGIVKNNNLRRSLIHDFEVWLADHRMVILGKADSSIEGSKGNAERFYLLRVSAKH